MGKPQPGELWIVISPQAIYAHQLGAGESSTWFEARKGEILLVIDEAIEKDCEMLVLTGRGSGYASYRSAKPLR